MRGGERQRKCKCKCGGGRAVGESETLPVLVLPCIRPKTDAFCMFWCCSGGQRQMPSACGATVVVKDRRLLHVVLQWGGTRLSESTTCA